MKKLNSPGKSIIGCLLLIVLFMLGCGKVEESKEQISKNEIPEKQNFQIVLQNDVKKIDDDVVDLLIETDKSSGVYTFNNSADELEDLSEGDIVIFSGHSVRKIKKVEFINNEYKVSTEFVPLNKVIKDGEISWEKKFNWGDDTGVTKASIISGDLLFASDGDAGKVKFKGKIKGWDVSIELKPEAGSKLNIKITASKKRGDQKVASLIASGWISNFENVSSMNFSGGNLTNFQMNNRGLKGELELKFAAQGLGSDVALIDLPAKISLPIRVGWVPVNLILKANLKLYPEVRQGASSVASYKMTYDSDMGFTFGENATNPSGNLNTHEMSVTDETVSAGSISTGFGVGVEFPRFEISILNELVVPYFLLNIHSSTFYEPGILSNVPPCQEGKMNFKCIAGLSMKLFSLSYEHQKVLWEKERKWQTEGSNCSD